MTGAETTAPILTAEQVEPLLRTTAEALGVALSAYDVEGGLVARAGDAGAPKHRAEIEVAGRPVGTVALQGLFSLARPRLVLRAALPALLVSAGVGIALSRIYDYWYSAAGLAAGALVFALISAWYAIRVLSRIDYYYYAAY
jgi:hypothetical protein